LEEVLNHPLIQIALDRGIVVTPRKPQPARLRELRTKASLKQEQRVRAEDQNDVPQLRVTQADLLPDVDMLQMGRCVDLAVDYEDH